MHIYLSISSYFLSKKDDIFLFDLEISQEENYFAKARLVIDAYTPLPPVGTQAVIRGDTSEVFFKGVLGGSPVKIEGDFAEIELVAYPPDFKEKNESFQKKNRIPPYWDELWVRSEKHNDFQEIQDVRPSSLFCDRITGNLSQSDWFEGRQSLDLTQDFFPESLQVKRRSIPLKSCTVHVHAHWVQSKSGLANLSAPIRRAFPHFKMSTYTQKALLEKWPEPGKRLGRSGLWILKGLVANSFFMRCGAF